MAFERGGSPGMEVALKRSVPLAIALVLLCALHMVAGCTDSGDVDKARTLVKSGNTQYKAYSEEYLTLVDTIEKFFAGYSEGVKHPAAEVQADLQGFQAQLHDVLNKVEKGRAPYKAVLGLEGVEHYKEYVRQRLDMLAQLDKAKGVIQRTLSTVDASASSRRTPDLAALEAAKRELISLEMELSFIEVEADEYAKVNGLHI
jgi:hypothetical protein